MMKSIVSIFALGLFLVACASKPKAAPEHPVEALAGRDYFVTYVKPILETQCLRCHQGANPPAGLSLVQRSGAFAPRKRDKAFIVPGDPGASLLLAAVSREGAHPLIMPRLDITLTDDDIGALYEWIEDGAYWPDNPDGFLQPRYNIENP
jgi:hypothetical protein